MEDYSVIPDERLVSMTLDGDNYAYSELVHRYKDMVSNLASGMLSEHHTAEDIVQETLIDGYVHLADLKDRTKFASWLYGMAKRKSLHFLTRRRRHAELEECRKLTDTDSVSPEELYLQKEKSAVIRHAVEKLSAKNRETVQLFYLENRSVAEIAEFLSLPEGTVKSRLYEARVKLKQELASLGRVQTLPSDFEADNGRGMLLFHRAREYINKGNTYAARMDFLAAIRMCEKSSLQYALAVCGLKTLTYLEQYADDLTVRMDICAEMYERKDSAWIFARQPGYSVGKTIIYEEKHWMHSIFYFISRFDHILLDPTMECGKVYVSQDEQYTLVLQEQNTEVCVRAGEFSDCLYLCLNQTDGYRADIWYANGVGLVKVRFSNIFRRGKICYEIDETYELYEYGIKGGEGYFPVCTGNRWNYGNPLIPDYLYTCYEYEMLWTDGDTVTLSTVGILNFQKNFLETCKLDSDVLFREARNRSDEYKLTETIALLKRAVYENTSEAVVWKAQSILECCLRMKEYYKKGYRFCPSSCRILYLTADYSYIYRYNDIFPILYRFGTRYEENRIFGVKIFQYLDCFFRKVWDGSWACPTSFTTFCTENEQKIPVAVCIEKVDSVITPAGSFQDCLKLTIHAEIPDMPPDYYFSNNFRYTKYGKKEYWYAKGVGIVRLDCTWGDMLSSSCVLVSNTCIAVSDSYMPLAIGNRWEYDEVNLTREGYRARRMIEILGYSNEMYLMADHQEFLFLGTEEAYEEFRKNL